MELVDTHCHIHFPDYELDPAEAITAAQADGVTQLICVGCTLPDSQLAIQFAQTHHDIWASIGLHPHESARYVHDHHALQQFHDLAAKYARPSRLDGVQGAPEQQTEPYMQYGEGVAEGATQQSAKSTSGAAGFAGRQAGVARKVVAIGETGLDFHYNHSLKADQEKLLRFQLDVAMEHNLPLIFHVREAFNDFWRIFDDYTGVRGVVHSFSAHQKELDETLARNLFVGLNGIMTFTKDRQQLAAAKSIPLDKLLLETDAPFLTPVPFRGTICQPKHVRVTAEFLSQLRDESLEELAGVTTRNAQALFNLK